MAQASQNVSPYSRYGVGTLLPTQTAFGQAMQGTTLGLYNGQQINLQNPASYAHLDSLSFLVDAGVSAQRVWLSSTTTSAVTNKAGFDYLNLAFRLRKAWGLAVSVQPYSKVGYQLSNAIQTLEGGVLGSTKSLVSNLGEGGLNRAMLGMGYAPFANLSIGANFAYLWGNMSHSTISAFDNNSIQSLRRSYETEIRSYTLDLGLQYTQKVNTKNSLVLGLNYGLGHELSGTSYFYNQSLLTAGGIQNSDTLRLKNGFSLPNSLGVGLMWNWNNSLRLGLDYHYQNWAKATAPIYQSHQRQFIKDQAAYTDRHRVALGAEYVKNAMGYSWAQRVRYRAGLSYTTGYQMVGLEQAPATLAASVGLGLPISTKYSNRNLINLGLHYETMPSVSAGMVRESYLRFSVGISFNERWFAKWRID